MPAPDLPNEILHVTGPDAAYEQRHAGTSGEVWLLTSDRGRFVLRVAPGSRLAAELAAEQRILRGLEAHVPFVPSVLAYALDGETGFSLLSHIQGTALSEALQAADTAERHALVAIYAWSLKRVHAWQPEFPRPLDWLSRALERVERRIRSGAVPDRFDRSGQFRGMSATEMLERLRHWSQDIETDLVFCHCDYRMLNVLARDGMPAGVIDWPAAGYADRRLDLATACQSIAHSLRADRHVESYTDTFLQAYGFEGPRESLELFEALYALS